MSRPATTIFVFGVYLAVLGSALVVAPNAVLALFGVPPTTEAWIQVLGAVGAVLGGYYIQAARHDLVPFFRATVWGRAAGLILFVGFVLLGLAPPILALFGVIDGLGGLWTALALRSARETARPEDIADPVPEKRQEQEEEVSR